MFLKYTPWTGKNHHSAPLYFLRPIPCVIPTAGKIQPHDIIAIPLISEQGIISEVVAFYRSGLRIPQIAERLGVAKSTVRSKSKAAGISFEKESAYTALELALWVYVSGWEAHAPPARVWDA